MDDQKQTIDKKEYFPVLQDPDYESGNNNVKQENVSFDDAIVLTGFGRYNIGILVTSCLLVLFMCVDIFGFSVVLPPAACDLDLTTEQQGLLTAVPFRIQIPGLSMEYRPWRLLMQVNTLPGVLGFIGLLFLHESPKFARYTHYKKKSIQNYSVSSTF